MKKMISMMLILCLLGGLMSAVAEGLQLDGVVDENLTIEGVFVPKSTDIVRGGKTTDSVSVNGTVVKVKTDTGMIISYDKPEGVMTLTQNYLLDIDLYNSIFADPAAVIQEYNEYNMHLNIFRVSDEMNYDAYIYTYENDSIGSVIGNAIELDEEDAGLIANYLEMHVDIPFTFGILGNQLWFLGNDVSENHLLWLFTWVDGCMIKINVRVASETEASISLDDLSNLSIIRE